MPTAKPRITITLEPRHHEVLSRLSAASGDSMSQIVAGFVELAVPSLERVVVVLERAKAAPQEVRAGLSAAIDRADRALIPMLQAAAAQTDFFLEDVSEVVAPRSGTDAERPPRGGGRRQAKSAPRGGPTPVPVTRGSGGQAPGGVKPGKGVRRG